MDVTQIQQGLQRYYERNWAEMQLESQAVTISQVENMTTGWESELFAFMVETTARDQRQQAPRVARLHQGASAGRKAVYEFATLQRLAQVGYPVPQVYTVDDTGAFVGKPFLIIEKIQGRSMGGLLQAAPSPAAFQAVLTQFAQLFVQLHALDWRPFVTAAQAAQPRDDYYFIDQWLTRANERCQSLAAIDFSPLVTWLADHRTLMACRQPAPVHQDFHPDNILIRADGTPVVIDWTTFAITDARFDLAWTLVLADMHLSTAMREQIQQIYETVRGQPVEQLDCFLVTACFRRLMDFAISFTAGAEQTGMRAEAVIAMQANQPAFVRAYDLLVSLTKLRLPLLETLLTNLA